MATGSDAPISPVQAICETKSAGGGAGRRLKRLLLEVGGPDGLAVSDAPTLGLVEPATVGLLDATTEGLGAGDTPLHAVIPVTRATTTVARSRCLTTP
jgi:hypothetical protein